MALALQGNDLLTQAEFTELVKGLDGDAPRTGVLPAWWAGEEIPPDVLHRTFAIELRVAATTPRSEELIDHVLRRIEELHPEEVPH